MDAPNLNAIWSDVIVNALAQCGVQDAVIAPGSRSTPLALALARRRDQFRLISVADERSAGFCALGLARRQEAPAVVVCTSGSAPTHLLPAIAECHHAGLPLLVISADRPAELQGRGAAQTTDQLGIFGTFVKRSYDLGAPGGPPAAWRGLRATVTRAVLESLIDTPGAIHLNAPFRKPLEPSPETDADRQLRSAVRDAFAWSPLHTPIDAERPPSRGAIEQLKQMFLSAEHGLIACGAALDATPRRAQLVAELSHATGFPVVAEATSGLRLSRTGPRLMTSFDLLARTEFIAAAPPQVALVLGAPPSGFGWTRMQSKSPVGEIVVSPHGLPDPYLESCCFIHASIDATLQELVAIAGRGEKSSAWTQRWLAAEETASILIARQVEMAAPCLTEPAAVRTAVSAWNEGELLLANSLPVREVDLFCGVISDAVRVHHQRGLNGIDGLISRAAGIAMGKRPTMLLIGDVAFLHDIGGLAVARRAAAPLVIVVLDNEGGRIFDQLPLNDAAVEREALVELFLMPPSLDLEAAAKAFGIPCAVPQSSVELVGAIDAARLRSGASIIWARVAPTSTREAVTALTQALSAHLSGL